MLMLALIVFVAVALGGDIMAIQVFRKRPIPAFLPRAHLIAATAGLAVLAIAVFAGDVATAAWIALGIFAAGFAGGYTLFGVVFRGKRPPIWAVAVHGTIGWAGVVALFLAL